MNSSFAWFQSVVCDSLFLQLQFPVCSVYCDEDALVAPLCGPFEKTWRRGGVANEPFTDRERAFVLHCHDYGRAHFHYNSFLAIVFALDVFVEAGEFHLLQQCHTKFNLELFANAFKWYVYLHNQRLRVETVMQLQKFLASRNYTLVAVYNKSFGG